MESDVGTFVVDTDGTHPKPLFSSKFILVGRLPPSIGAEHARNCYSSLLISCGNDTQSRPQGSGERVSSMIETKQRVMQKETITLFGLACENVSSGLWKPAFEEEGRNLRTKDVRRQTFRKRVWQHGRSLRVSLSHLWVNSVTALLQNCLFYETINVKDRFSWLFVICIWKNPEW